MGRAHRHNIKMLLFWERQVDRYQRCPRWLRPLWYHGTSLDAMTHYRDAYQRKVADVVGRRAATRQEQTG